MLAAAAYVAYGDLCSISPRSPGCRSVADSSRHAARLVSHVILEEEWEPQSATGPDRLKEDDDGMGAFRGVAGVDGDLLGRELPGLRWSTAAKSIAQLCPRKWVPWLGTRRAGCFWPAMCSGTEEPAFGPR